MTTGPADIVSATSWEAQSQNQRAKPLPGPRELWEIINVCYCEPLSVNVIYFVVIDSEDKDTNILVWGKY